MANAHGFNDAEWELILYIPFVVFFTVAKADGKISHPESKTFAMVADKVGKAAPVPGNTLVHDVMAQVSLHFDEIAQRMDHRVGQGLTFQDILSAGRDLLARVDPDQRTSFNAVMIRLAELVAEAWPIFGRSVTADEQKAIAVLSRGLGVAGPGDAFVPFAT